MRKRKAEVESELGRICTDLYEELGRSIQAKERVASIGYQRIAAELCTRLSYRGAAEIINDIQHRKEGKTVKVCTMRDGIERMGRKIRENLEEGAGKIMRTYGFDSETGVPQDGISLESVMTAGNPEWCRKRETVDAAIDSINTTREEKLPDRAAEEEIETGASACVYVSIDEVGVKHQKTSRKIEVEKSAKYVENTVIHIQQGEDRYVLTAPDMKQAMKSLLAFLLFNGLLHKKLIFFTDGARNIRNRIADFFSFCPHRVILDWFHLKKKCQELLSMALKGKDIRNKVLQRLLRILWTGNVKGAVSYLETLDAARIKSQKWLQEQIHYLLRKEDGIVCYALRAHFGLRNSSNCVEKENDLLVAQRQKHNGMSWSVHGSCALAAIEMVFHNGYDDIWFRQGRISFFMPHQPLPVVS